MNLVKPKQTLDPRKFLEAQERAQKLETWRQAQNALQPDREALFALVADPEDWRAEIEAFIPWAMNIPPEDVMDAIQHFTGAGVTITHVNHGYTVKSDGYRKGPCGP